MLWVISALRRNTRAEIKMRKSWNVVEVCLLLGVAAMAVSPWAHNPEVGFAFGTGLVMPGMWQFCKECWNYADTFRAK